LLVVTTVSAALVLALLRRTGGLEGNMLGPLAREWIVGAALAAAVLLFVGAVVGATRWPVRLAGQPFADFAGAITNQYLVALVVTVILLAGAALGAGLLLAEPITRPLNQGRRR
jgi:hypothetical protein